MSKESSKTKTSTKKSDLSSNTDFETILKNQKNIILRLKTELKSLKQKVLKSETDAAQMEKIKLELQESINERDIELNNLKPIENQLKEENAQYLIELNAFKEKYYQIETEYDKRNQEFVEHETKIKTVSQNMLMTCQDLETRLQDKDEQLQNFNELKLNFEQKRNENEMLRMQLIEEKKLNEEKRKFDLETLTDEIKQKDEALKQCIAAKHDMEKEKNVIIEELNNKILRIERAFVQPSKFVPPMVTLPQANISKNTNKNGTINLAQNVEENRNRRYQNFKRPLQSPISSQESNNSPIKENQNVEENRNRRSQNFKRPLQPITSTQQSNISAQVLSNNENQNVEQNQSQRNHNFEHPLQPTTSSQQSELQTFIAPQRKQRKNQLRKSAVDKKYTEFSSSSDDDSDNESRFSIPLWCPNDSNLYVPDTDASDGFNKNKRVRK